ncbi:hypothetical protein C0581_03410 [Candidatus Parcubacteria bacterium]|nr:MAG: hypothetical protein C0581_03410 [Candidatus Parcubacteria bacterium]
MDERRREQQKSPEAIFTEMFLKAGNDFSVRQAIQMLMFLRDGKGIGDISDGEAEKFADMYNGKDPAVKTDIEIYTLEQANKGNVEGAVEFIREAYKVFPEKIALPKDGVVPGKKAA